MEVVLDFLYTRALRFLSLQIVLSDNTRVLTNFICLCHLQIPFLLRCHLKHHFREEKFEEKQ